MGGIMSGIDEIDSIQLVEIPSNKPVQVTAIRQGETVILKYNDFKISVARQIKTEKWAFPMSYSNWPWQHNFIDVLHRLKMINTKTRDTIHKAVIERDKKRSLKYDREQMVEISKKYGITLTDKQLKKLS